MLLRRCVLFTILVFNFTFVSASANPNRIYSVTMQNESSQLELSIDSAEALKFKPIILANPPRYVIDVDAARLSQHHFNVIENPILHGIRYAYKPNGQLRLVFDLNQMNHITVARQKRANYYQTLLQFHYQQAVNTNPPPRVQITARPVAQHDRVVVIDPGHGGKDPGAIGAGGVREKDIVLKISKLLCDRINQIPGYQAVLTRRGDYYLTLRQRLAIAREHHPDMFIAIHADAYADHEAHGASVFALSLRGATSEAARWLANRENASEWMGGVELDNKSKILRSVLLNLSQTATIRSSLQIGQNIMHSLGMVGGLHSSRVDQAAFVVLKSPDIPSLLIETGFVSNVYEERNLNTSMYQLQLVDAITTGIQNYFKNSAARDGLNA